MSDPEYTRIYHREVRSERRRLGLCLKCGKEPAIAGKTLGLACKEKSDDESRRRWANKREAVRESYRERRRLRAERGLCLECGKERSVPGRTLGAKCKRKNARRWKMTRRERERRLKAGRVVLGEHDRVGV